MYTGHRNRVYVREELILPDTWNCSGILDKIYPSLPGSRSSGILNIEGSGVFFPNVQSLYARSIVSKIDPLAHKLHNTLGVEFWIPYFNPGIYIVFEQYKSITTDIYAIQPFCISTGIFNP